MGVADGQCIEEIWCPRVGVDESIEPPPRYTAGARYHRFGGAEGTRTPDLLNAIQTRSQLRHSPTKLLLMSC
jgi:hypothetical protein